MQAFECHIKFSTHAVYIKVDESDHVHVFKYTDQQCDYEVFDNEYSASDFIFKNFDVFRARVVIYDYLGNQSE